MTAAAGTTFATPISLPLFVIKLKPFPVVDAKFL